jgi:NAD(P)-dependent dehydrogenase (short-subunit alcohol dehydrogenase family)
MAKELDGKVAVVTGGASGLGRATVETFVAEGAQVVVADVDADAGEELAESLGAAVAFKQTDVSQADQVQALIDFTAEQFGGLHVMFNNAGVGTAMTRFLHDDLSDFDRVMNINLRGAMLGTQRAARHMKDSGGGVIINNSSIAGINPGFGLTSYRIAKAAVIHFTKCVAIDLAPYGIRVNAVAPAHIRTAITNYEMDPVVKYMQPLQRQGRAEDVANAVVYLASERAAQITGIVLPVDGGTTAGPSVAQNKLIMGTGKEAPQT